MKSGQRQELVSRRTIATVDMHWQASTKKTINESATSGVQTLEPSARLAFRIAATSDVDCALVASSLTL